MTQAQRLYDAYGAGDPNAAARWQSLLEGDPASPLVVTNLFQIREQADTRWLEPDEAMTGFEAMLRYSAVSEAKVAALGGRFAAKALTQAPLMGETPPWNLLAVAEYDRRDQFVALFEDAEYQAAFRYRSAAVETQQVWLATPI